MSDPESPPVPSPDAARREDASRLAASRFGLELERFPAALINALLAELPEDISPQNEPAAALRLLSVCSVGETTFNRHPEHFATLAELISKGNVGETDRPLVVWSAGCATGEEAYSLAAALADRPGGARVIGTDVSAPAIARARAGRYRVWSLRGVDPANVSTWLDVHGPDVEVRAPVRELVEFRALNLVSDDYPSDVDVIFCRNVLLYFRCDAAAKVIQRFYEILRPGGVLFLGYVDAGPSMAPFTEAWLGQVRYWRKPAPDECTSPAAPPASPKPTALSSSRQEPRRELAPPAEAALAGFADELALARGLGGRGAHAEALALLAALSQKHPLAVEPYVLAAMVAAEAGEHVAALAAARRAYFLMPASPVTIFLLASCLDGVGDPSQAERRYAEASRALEGVEASGEALAHGEGMTAPELRRTIDARIQGK